MKKLKMLAYEYPATSSDIVYRPSVVYSHSSSCTSVQLNYCTVVVSCSCSCSCNCKYCSLIFKIKIPD